MHQPHRLKWFWPEESKGYKGKLEDLYFDGPLNEWTFHKVAGKCYHPTNDIILEKLDLLKKEKRPFKVSYSLTGTFLEQCERWDKDLLEKFRWMAETGNVQFLGETYYHSLASMFEDKEEFREQVKLHSELVKDLLGVKPQVFRNTELLYHDQIAEEAEKLGFKGILAEGIEHRE